MIVAILIELLLGAAAYITGLMSGFISLGVMGLGDLAILAVFVLIPGAVLALLLAVLYATLRQRYQRPFFWSVGAALLTSLLLFVGLSFLGTLQEDSAALFALLVLTLLPPLLQGLLSGGIAALRRRRPTA